MRAALLLMALAAPAATERAAIHRCAGVRRQVRHDCVPADRFPERNLVLIMKDDKIVKNSL